MEAWAAEVLNVWAENLDEIALELKAALDRDPTQTGRYSLEDVRQLMHGGIAILKAELEGQGTEMREAYLQSVLPGLFEQGLKLEALAAVTTFIAIRVHSLVVKRVSPENREKGGDFICLAYSKYMADTVRVGMDVLSAKA